MIKKKMKQIDENMTKHQTIKQQKINKKNNIIYVKLNV